VLIHNVEIKVFVKEVEDFEEIENTLLKLVSLDLEREKIELKQENLSGLNETQIKIFTIKLEKERHINQFVSHLVNTLTNEQLGMLIRQKESRLDDELYFFLRLEKTPLLEGKYYITDGGECFHIKMKIAAFPSTKEAGLKVIDKIFKR